MRMTRKKSKSSYMEENLPREMFREGMFLGECRTKTDDIKGSLRRSLLGIVISVACHLLFLAQGSPFLAILMLVALSWFIANSLHHVQRMRNIRLMVKNFEEILHCFVVCFREDLGEAPNGADAVLMRSYPSKIPGSPRWSALQWFGGGVPVAAVSRSASAPLDALFSFVREIRDDGDVLIDLSAVDDCVAQGADIVGDNRGGDKWFTHGMESAREFMDIKFFNGVRLEKENVVENT